MHYVTLFYQIHVILQLSLLHQYLSNQSQLWQLPKHYQLSKFIKNSSYEHGVTSFWDPNANKAIHISNLLRVTEFLIYFLLTKFGHYILFGYAIWNISICNESILKTGKLSASLNCVMVTWCRLPIANIYQVKM